MDEPGAHPPGVRGGAVTRGERRRDARIRFGAGSAVAPVRSGAEPNPRASWGPPVEAGRGLETRAASPEAVVVCSHFGQNKPIVTSRLLHPSFYSLCPGPSSPHVPTCGDPTVPREKQERFA